MQAAKASLPALKHLPPFLRAWCSITTSPSSKQPAWREELASLILPIALLDTVLGSLAAIGNWPQFTVLATVFGVILLAIVLKRMGLFFLAGILAVCSFEMGVVIHIVTWPHLGTAQLPLYALLIQTGFVVVAFFPPFTILIIGAINCAFILISLHLLNIAPEMANTLARDGSEVLAPMLSLQIFVSVITWIIMVTLIRAITRADNAEELTTLERNARIQQERELELKEQLEEGIEKLLSSLNAVTTRGDFSVRVPLSQENILWRVGHAFNNLLARLQGLRRDTKELEKTRLLVGQLVEHVRRGQQFPLEQWTGTSLDPLIVELNKQFPADRRFEPPERSRQ